MKTTDTLEEMVPCPESAGHEQTPKIRIDKVRQVQHKLKSGKYNLNEHLSVAMDRLIEEILVEDSEKLNNLSGYKKAMK